MIVLLLVLISFNAWASLGDNAPPIPSTWVISHPRLPFPTNAWLKSLHNNRPAYYTDAAGNYISQNGQFHIQLRYAALAYQAAKAAGANLASEPYATWKATIIGALDKFGLTSQTILGSDDSVTGNGSGGITTTNLNLQTGCGGTCQGKILSAYGRWYIIQSVTGANTATLITIGARYASAGYPSGATKIRIADTYPNMDYAAYVQAILYDWMYEDLTPIQRTDFANSLDGLCQMMTREYENELAASGGYSPYNDLFYGPGGNSQFVLALSAASVAIYPDHANGLPHVRRYADLLFNVVLPAWKRLGGTTLEGWNEYFVLGQTHWIVPFTLPWAHASGRGTAFFTTDHTYLKNFALWWMNILRPDYMLPKIGETKGYFDAEGTLCGGQMTFTTFSAIAEIYNDPAIRGFNRKLNSECGANHDAPDGYVPSAWPYYDPDTPAKSVAALATMPKQAHFPGAGIIVLRTGWGESDTQVIIDYGDKHWTGKEYASAGHFLIYNRGSLAITSGIPACTGSYATHRKFYASQTVAHNTLLFKDPADDYPAQKTPVIVYGASQTCAAFTNDGGQRRVNAVQNYWSSSDCTTGNAQNGNLISPVDDSAWLRKREWWKMSSLLAYVPHTAYTYVAVDITRAYQRDGAVPSAFDRTRRLVKAIRHFLFIPRGTAAYLLVYDQTITTNQNFTKKWLLHSINSPTVAGNHFTITRTENANAKPFPGIWPFGWMAGSISHENNSCPLGWCYQYNGRLEGWTFVNGSARTPVAVGGPGFEFDDNAGTNQKGCQNDVYCGSASYDAGMGFTAGEIRPENTAAPFEPGAWRLELTPASAARTDHFLALMYATDNGGTIAQASVTPTSTSTTYGVTWTDNGGTCSYAATFVKSGVGGAITATGAGCANAI